MQLLQTYAQLQTFEKGQIIYSPGHYQHSLGIIVRGRAVVEKECGVLLNDLGAGQCFGAAALFVRRTSMSPPCAPKRLLHPVFVDGADAPNPSAKPGHCLQLHPLSVRKIQFLNRKIDSFTAPGAQQALLSYLRQQPGGKSVGLSMVKLSEMLNIGRTSLYRAVEQLEQCGKIKREGKTIQLMPESPSPEER